MASQVLRYSRTPARRTQDVLTRASSAHVTWLDSPDLRSGRIPGLLLDPAPGCGHLAPAVVELADPAPLAVRDRIRVRVRIQGHAAFDGEPLRMRPLSVRLLADGRDIPVDLDELQATGPDPFAGVEAQLLSHLASGHPAELGALRRLLPAELRGGLVTPLALDAGGLTLRAELGMTWRDVRLEFAAAARTGEEIRGALAALVESARAPRVAELFRSGPAAAQICRPDL